MWYGLSGCLGRYRDVSGKSGRGDGGGIRVDGSGEFP